MNKLITGTVILLLSTSVFAIDWSNHGLTVSEVREAGEKKTAVLTDKDNNTLYVTYSEDISENTAKIIARLNTDLRSWESMKVSELHFSVHNGSIEILINPSSYAYKGKDYLTYLSAGLYFTFTDGLYYNFRIAVNKVFVIIKGTYTDEASLNEKMATAIEDPRGYMKRRDPEYLLEQVETLSSGQYQLRLALIATIKNRPIEPNLVNKVVEIKKANPAYTAKEIYEALKEQDIKISQSDIKIILRVFFNEFD